MACDSDVEKYIASMVLSGVGDAMGYRNGRWEFCSSGEAIHKELKGLNGIAKLKISLPKWKVSDDTIMHIATAESLANCSKSEDMEQLYQEIATHYKACMSDMQGRSAGFTSRGNAYALQPGKPKGYHLPFDERGGGCGAAMRAMCIGLRYPHIEQEDKLIAVGVEAGRMTHHHPTGYLGSLTTALFTSYAVQGRPLWEWGAGLMTLLPRAMKYIESQGRYVKENKEAWTYFEKMWKEYLKLRKLETGTTAAVFPEPYDIKHRDEFYTSVSYGGWGGASGHDAPMIAYDALMGGGNSWEEVCLRGMLHGGDNDSTGAIAGAWFGALFGFEGVPHGNYKNLEYRDRLANLGGLLYNLAHPNTPAPADTFVKPPNTDSATEGQSTQKESHMSAHQCGENDQTDMVTESHSTEKESVLSAHQCGENDQSDSATEGQSTQKKSHMSAHHGGENDQSDMVTESPSTEKGSDLSEHQCGKNDQSDSATESQSTQM